MLLSPLTMASYCLAKTPELVSSLLLPPSTSSLLLFSSYLTTSTAFSFCTIFRPVPAYIASIQHFFLIFEHIPASLESALQPILDRFQHTLPAYSTSSSSLSTHQHLSNQLHSKPWAGPSTAHRLSGCLHSPNRSPSTTMPTSQNSPLLALEREWLAFAAYIRAATIPSLPES